jgi:hypothetical protein
MSDFYDFRLKSLMNFLLVCQHLNSSRCLAHPPGYWGSPRRREPSEIDILQENFPWPKHGPFIFPSSLLRWYA